MHPAAKVKAHRSPSCSVGSGPLLCERAREREAYYSRGCRVIVRGSILLQSDILYSVFIKIKKKWINFPSSQCYNITLHTHIHKYTNTYTFVTKQD